MLSPGMQHGPKLPQEDKTQITTMMLINIETCIPHVGYIGPLGKDIPFPPRPWAQRYLGGCGQTAFFKSAVVHRLLNMTGVCWLLKRKTRKATP